MPKTITGGTIVTGWGGSEGWEPCQGDEDYDGNDKGENDDNEESCFNDDKDDGDDDDAKDDDDDDKDDENNNHVSGAGAGFGLWSRVHIALTGVVHIFQWKYGQWYKYILMISIMTLQQSEPSGLVARPIVSREEIINFPDGPEVVLMMVQDDDDGDGDGA